MSPGEQLAVAIERLGAVQRQASWRGATPVGIGGLQARIIELLDGARKGDRQRSGCQLGVRIPTASTSVTALHATICSRRRRRRFPRQLLTLTPTGRALPRSRRAVGGCCGSRRAVRGGSSAPRSPD